MGIYKNYWHAMHKLLKKIQFNFNSSIVYLVFKHSCIRSQITGVILNVSMT